MNRLVVTIISTGIVLMCLGCPSPTANQPDTNAVTYEGNGSDGGTVPTDSTVYEEGDVVTVLDAGTMTRSGGYFFSGWNTAADGSGTDRAPGSTFTMGSADVTLYAQWNDLLPGVLHRDLVTVNGGTFTQQSDVNEDGDVLDPNESFNHTISSFEVGKYEVTYDLWYSVYQWAISNGYTFANAGREGSSGTDGAVPTTAKYEPVARINWRDTVVWCNAYSEISGYTPVYRNGIGAVIRDSRDTNGAECDAALPDWGANGFRLLTEGEWQYAASYQDGTNWTPYNYASGANTFYNSIADTNPANGVFDGKDANDQVAVYYRYWDGSNWQDTGVTKSADVGTKAANQLGLYDFSGNILEFCWDWHADYPVGSVTDYRGPGTGIARQHRGGCWQCNANDLPIGARVSSNTPDLEHILIGFRFARTP